MTISVIVAMSENRVIGRDNKLPWKLSEDLKRFKRLTMGHHLIMGRKTFQAIGRPLPGRIMLVVSRNPALSFDGVEVFPSFDQALGVAMAGGDLEVFVAGGGDVFAQALPIADRIYLTLIHRAFEGDTFFPEFRADEWRLLEPEERQKDPKSGLEYSFLDYERVPV